MPWEPTINGEKLNVAPGESISWTVAVGEAPQSLQVELTAARAERIYARAQSQFSGGSRTRERGDPVGPLTLKFENSDNPAQTMEAKGLYAIELGPGRNYQWRSLLIVNRFWLAQRTLVERAYNMRKPTGSRRLNGAELAAAQLGIDSPDYAFKRGTLNNGARWQAREVLHDVMAEVFGEVGIKEGAVGRLSDDVEGLTLSDMGPAALSRVRGLLPGVAFYQSLDGRVTTSNLYDGSEVAALTALGATADGGGDWRLVSRPVTVPRTFRAHFTTTLELRFDYVELADGATRTDPVASREPRELENVIPNPLLQLTLADGSVSTKGEYLTFDKFLGGVEVKRVADGMSAQPLTLQLIRESFLGDWVGRTTQYLVDARTAGTPADWQAILSAIRTHWRQTFRVLPAWVDKLRGLSPWRVSVIDQENGTRARAPVFTQYIQRLSQLGLAPKDGARQNLQVDDYADNVNEARPSPFEVMVIDSAQGVFRVAGRVDEQGNAYGYTLGQVTGDLPSADVRDAVALWGHCELSSTFKLAVILSATRDLPANIGRLWEQQVTVDEAAARLGVPTPPASGPDMDLRPTEEPARFGWDDDQAAVIEEAIYEKDAKLPEDRLVNEAQVKDVAVAHAARQLVARLPRGRGTVKYSRMHPKLEPTGSIRSVTHTLAVPSSGIGAFGSTTVVMSAEVELPSVWSAMTEGTRRLLRNQVEE